MSDELAMGLVELKRDEVLETVKVQAERGDDPLKILDAMEGVSYCLKEIGQTS